ncbi:hypothetical protein M378DRAFT_1027498 [Amanita muscaria Koide BX008]|uniref:Uncharacterized protein n=1 Tax=Amanita muscaria (strain Koide BX008) TaxID=946122 RepID=A0A0C2S585_AMAMK|nr:hypothetical protein M378DRAFT_1027498 [Amanita muscaria Koide BX008]
MLTEFQMFVVTVIAQTLLYGIYLETLIQCLRWLIFTDEGWKPQDKINSLIVAFATGFIFLMSTTNLITALKYTLETLRRDKFTVSDIGIVMGVSEYLTFLSIDYVLIYRCWIVYGKSWRVICVPVTFWLGSLACSVLPSYYATLNFLSPNLNTFQSEEKVLISLYVCNMATTIYTTTAIIYRIWYTAKAGGGSPKRLHYIMRILAESGILYTCTVTFRLAGAVLVSRNESCRYFLTSWQNFSMAGISFNLLLMRVYQSRLEQRDSLAESRHVDGVQTLSGMQFNNPQITTVSSEGPPCNARQVNEAIDEIQEHRRSSDGMHVN